MKIEEAILHARTFAESCPADNRDCAYQHDKLAAWLEELKAYKDTGLTPEEVMALQASNEALKKEAVPLIKAKIDERLVILPYRVTESVYVLESVYKGRKIIGERVVSAQIDHVVIGGTTGKPVYDLCSETGRWYKSMEPGDFYLTAEEAEAALKKAGTEGNEAPP